MKIIKLSLVLLLLTGLVLAGQAMHITQNYAEPTLKLSQYSDRNITTNAISLNDNFKSLAFAPVPESKGLTFKDSLASVISSIKNLFKSNKKAVIKEHGTWLWTPTLSMTDDYMEDILSVSKSEGVDTMYLSIDSYLDIYVLPEGEERSRLHNEFVSKIEKFIEMANQRGIEVDAEAGWRNWAEPGHTYKPLAITNFVIDYNNSSKHQFRGLQYDIEPYLLDEYKEDPAGVLKNFIALVDQTSLHLGENNLSFSVVVPEFFDKRDRQSPIFSYQGARNSTFGHLLTVLDKRDRSSIIIMSYRNFAKGKDGSIEISKNEMRTARLGRHSTKIVLAQETGDVEPDYITFFNTSKSYFSEQLTALDSEFSNNSSYGGTAVHYANAYFGLR